MRQALAITAKAPRPGTVKTRLRPLLSDLDAAELYGCFLEDTLALAEAIPGIEIIISYTPAGDESYFGGINSRARRLIVQRGEALGDRLYNAFEDLFGEGFDSVAMMNADSPTLPRDYVARAFEELRRRGDRAVLGPADDGGYYLVGLKRLHRRIFEQIPWSSNRVLAVTLERAREIGLEVALLPSWYDVDGPDELQRLSGEIASSRDDDQNNLLARNTRRFILSRFPASLGLK
jgi:rSAM/selenodomain-associated transferase 1